MLNQFFNLIKLNSVSEILQVLEEHPDLATLKNSVKLYIFLES